MLTTCHVPGGDSDIEPKALRKINSGLSLRKGRLRDTYKLSTGVRGIGILWNERTYPVCLEGAAWKAVISPSLEVLLEASLGKHVG